MEDDRIRVIADEIVKKEIDEYNLNICGVRHQEVHEMKNDIKELNKFIGSKFDCINNKFNKLYLLLITMLTAIIVNLFK